MSWLTKARWWTPAPAEAETNRPVLSRDLRRCSAVGECCRRGSPWRGCEPARRDPGFPAAVEQIRKRRARTISQACDQCLTCRPQAKASYAMRSPRRAARSARVRRVRGGSRRIVDGRRVDIAANEHQIGAERLHHAEFAFGALEITRALRLRHRLKIPERLKGCDRQTELAADPPHFGRSAVRRSLSKSSTPSNPTDAAASSFSGRVQASETVAIERGNKNGAEHTTPPFKYQGTRFRFRRVCRVAAECRASNGPRSRAGLAGWRGAGHPRSRTTAGRCR